jgi:hypothetical protein
MRIDSRVGTIGVSPVTAQSRRLILLFDEDEEESFSTTARARGLFLTSSKYASSG